MKDIKKLNKRLTFGIILLLTLTIILNIGRSYAFFQKTVSTNKPVIIIKTPKEPPVKYPTAVEVIKGTLGQTNGIVGITSSNSKVTSESTNIREYRYVGANVKNYIYFNCQDNYTEEDAKDKCEIWRVIGVFKEDNEEYVKIVRNEKIDVEFYPENYKIGDITYKIKSNRGAAFFNYVTGTKSDSNDWREAGIQYWLNTEEDETVENPNKGYLSLLSINAKNLLRTTKYYLGTVRGGGMINDIKYTVVNAYSDERNTDKIWTGKVALMYPSDVTFSFDTDSWKSRTLYDYSVLRTSWLYDADYSLLMNPDVHDSFDVTTLSRSASGGTCVRFTEVYEDSYHYVYPTVSLISNAQILFGNGTSATPWGVGL